MHSAGGLPLVAGHLAALRFVPDAVALDVLLAQVKTPAQIEGLFQRLKGRMVEPVLQAELTAHLGYAPGGERADGNACNGTSAKTVLTDDGELALAIPRDRAGRFAPVCRRTPTFP